MKTFKDFGIKIDRGGVLVGQKIKVSKVLNKQITVHKFKLEPSKTFPGGQCLHLQVEVDGAMHVIFTGSTGMIQAIKQVPSNELPFKTTIIEDNDRYEFT